MMKYRERQSIAIEVNRGIAEKNALALDPWRIIVFLGVNNAIYLLEDQVAEISKLLSLGDVAKMLSLSPHTVRSLVRKGKLQPLRICRRLLFHPDELSRFISAANPAHCNQVQ